MAFVRTLFAFMAALLLFTPSVSALQSGIDLTGQWRGENSGNRVTIEMRPGGFAVAFSQVQRAGQADGAYLFRNSGGGTYRYTFPNGTQAVARIQNSDTLRITNPDGWTDLFRRTSPPRAAAPAPSPKAAPKAAAPTEKLPPARPAKTAPWSPEAMPTGSKALLSPKFAAERADALVSCSAPIGRYASHRKITPREANFLVEQEQLQDSSIDNDVQAIRDHIAKMQRQIAAGTLTPGEHITRQIAVCTFTRRIAQLEGSPLATGAVDGRLTPLSIGSSETQWKQRGKDARIIASDGKSAMECVKLEQLASGDSGVSGGGRVLANRCSGEVEIVWCYSPGDCDTETGSGWTVQPGKSWPVSANKYIHWAACHGRDTATFVKGSHGLRYYCSAPAKK